jgi:hypothetical protein
MITKAMLVVIGWVLIAATARAQDPVKFYQPSFVDPPEVLLGDSGDGRCPDASQPCFKDNDDMLNGRRHLLRTDDLIVGIGTPGVGERHFSELLFTENSTIVAKSELGPFQLTGDLSGTVVAGARLFDTPHDVAVSVVIQRPDRPGNGILFWFLDAPGNVRASGSTSLPPIPQDPTGFLNMATGDFTGDGLDEVVVFLTANAIVGTARDRTGKSQELDFGDVHHGFNVEPLAIAVGTVLGRPRIFVAGPSHDNDPSCATRHRGLRFESFSVDPQSLAIASEGTFDPTALPEGNNACLHSVDLTVGRFGNATHDQLVVTYAMDVATYKVVAFDIHEGIAVQGPVFDTGAPVAVGVGRAWIRSGQFDWTSPFDQAALLISNGAIFPQTNTLRILRFDRNLHVTSGDSTVGTDASDCASDLAVGNFDRMKTNPHPPPQVIRDPNLQLAVAFSTCSRMFPNLELKIFDVDPAKGFQVTEHSSHEEGTLDPLGTRLAAVDLQGRSYRLGTPATVTIAHKSQPELVLAAPPMHVDGVIPSEGGKQRVYNVTAVPDGFHATYTVSDTSNDKSTTTTGTTWSWGAKETMEGKGEIGACELGDCIDFGIKASAQQALDSSTAAMTEHYTSSDQRLSVRTGFGDQVAYRDETLTIYVYPVIGRTVCPSAEPTCAENQKVPLTVNMAGPDTIRPSTFERGDVNTAYQPPWMPGHVLSYPGHVDQLKAATFQDPTDFQQLSQPTRWFTGDGQANASATWTGGSSSGTTVGFNQNYSFETDMSASYKWSVGGLDSLAVGVELDLSGSFGFSNLTDHTTTLAKTQGIEFARTASFEKALYGYFVSPYLFGKRQRGGVVDDKPLSTETETFGALRTAHVVDLGGPNESCCQFWHSWYGQAPDVGLNQPTHWVVAAKTSDSGDGNCRLNDPNSSNFDCATPGERTPDNPWISEFHWMRGLFITGPSGTGPQLQTATTGDQLLLQARVYNLSLAAMPAGTRVHVRFMGMPWHTDTSKPAGPSFQIGEQTVGPILPFNSETAHPNWLLVPQPFDTGGTHCGGHSCDNTFLVFWVVVWMTDASTGLVPELPLHGFSAIPASGADFAAVAALEERDGNGHSYSNNLGFYNQPFYIFPKASAPTAQEAPPPAGEVGAEITAVGSAARRVQRGERTLVAATVRTGSRELTGGLKLRFYDGDPRRDGKLFGLHVVPHLRADSTYDFRVSFRSSDCGRHTLYVVAGQGTRHEHTARLRPIQVVCRD